jgi:arylsulfatase A-like enzyme
MVQSLDSGVGRVLAALADAGRERDTLVIFTSDNGGERFSFNWPHQRHKGTLWEGGIRVPAIVRWPGTVPAGRASGQPLISMDWTATMLALAGVSPSPAYPLDGRDLGGLLTGARSEFERTLFWRQPALNFNGEPPQAAVREGRWKYLRIAEVARLFDLVADPGERHDRLARTPDVGRRLRAALERWEATLPQAGNGP